MTAAPKAERIRADVRAYVEGHPDCTPDQVQAAVVGQTGEIRTALDGLVAEGRVEWRGDRHDSRRRRLRWAGRRRRVVHECSRGDPWIRALCSRSPVPCLHGRGRPAPPEIAGGRAAGVRGALAPRVGSVRGDLPTRADDLLRLARRHGRPLDPTQRLVLRDALRVDLGRQRWGAFEVALVQPRQSGKNEVVELVELGGVQAWGMRLVVHTAHEVPTTSVALERMSMWADAPDLRNPVVRVVRAPSGGSVEFANGAVIRYVARTAAKGRGWSEADMVVFDEAMMSLDPMMLQALTPAMSIAPNPQVWYLASGDLPESVHLRRLRGRARMGDERLAWLEHSTAKPDDGAMLDVTDRALWHGCMPALAAGRVSEDFIADQIGVLGVEGFATEYLCVWSDREGSDLFPERGWSDAAAPAGGLGGRVAMAFGVSEDLTAFLVAACRVSEDRVRAELVAEWPSVERARRDMPILVEGHRPAAFRWFKSGPAAMLATELSRLGRPFGESEVPELCAELVGLVGDGLEHDGSASLWSQASRAVKLAQGRRWVFDPAAGAGGLYALAGAVREARRLPLKATRRKVILPSG